MFSTWCGHAWNTRVPAPEMEKLVLKAVGSADSEEVRSSEEVLRLRVERVIVRADRVEIVKSVANDGSSDPAETLATRTLGCILIKGFTKSRSVIQSP